MKTYISIPITGHDISKVRERADRIRHALSRHGLFCVSPFDIYAGANPEYADYICADLRALMDCEAVYFANGWRDSLGCSMEHDAVMRINEFAERYGIRPIRIINHEDVPDEC